MASVKKQKLKDMEDVEVIRKEIDPQGDNIDELGEPKFTRKPLEEKQEK